MTNTLEFQHNFECAHRLPFLGGKCENLHGHSWLATFTLQADKDADGITIEYAAAKKAVRDWIDTWLDHGCMLGAQDILCAFTQQLGKVYVFGNVQGDYSRGLPWPTVENVAEMLWNMCYEQVERITNKPFRVVSVRVQEQAYHAMNASTYYYDEDKNL